MEEKEQAEKEGGKKACHACLPACLFSTLSEKKKNNSMRQENGLSSQKTGDRRQAGTGAEKDKQNKAKTRTRQDRVR